MDYLLSNVCCLLSILRASIGATNKILNNKNLKLLSQYNASLLHMLIHAFFKALLFMGAGCVIHAMNNEQDV